MPGSATRAPAAEAALWAYDLEWSAIARNTIKNGTLLRKLGFGGHKSKKVPESTTKDDAAPPA